MGCIPSNQASGEVGRIGTGWESLGPVLHRWGHFPRRCNLVKGRSRKPGVKRVKIPDCGGCERHAKIPLPTMLCTNCTPYQVQAWEK